MKRAHIRLMIVVALLDYPGLAVAARVDGAWRLELDGCFSIDGGPSDCTKGELPITVVQTGEQLSGILRIADQVIPAVCNPQCLPATDPGCQFVYRLNGTVTGNVVHFEINVNRHMQASCPGCALAETYVDRLVADGTVAGRTIAGTWSERLDAVCQASEEECTDLLNCVSGNASGTFEIDLPPLGPCYGDCDIDAVVTLREVVGVVERVLDTSAPSCSRADGNSDGQIAIEDVVLAVGAASGCQ